MGPKCVHYSKVHNRVSNTSSHGSLVYIYIEIIVLSFILAFMHIHVGILCAIVAGKLDVIIESENNPLVQGF